MSLPPLAQSADKKELFARLNLNEHHHRLLLDEAQVTRDVLSSNSQNLTEKSRLIPNLAQPYKWDEISETAKHREILAIVSNANQITRHYYACGRYRTNVNEENWVARWYLWHSFRYRDNRDNRSRSAGNSGVQGSGHTSTQQATSNGYWDPVHNSYR